MSLLLENVSNVFIGAAKMIFIHLWTDDQQFIEDFVQF